MVDILNENVGFWYLKPVKFIDTAPLPYQKSE